MEESNYPPSPYLKKNFMFFDIDWAIDDFCLRMYEDEAEIQSPEFIGWAGAKFVLVLKSEKDESDASSSLFLYTKRSDDTGPTDVFVNWRLEIFGANYVQKAAVDDKLDRFKKKSEAKTYVTSKTDLINTILSDMREVNGTDSVTVECKMLGYSEDVKAEFGSSDDGLASLSEKLFDIYKSGVGSDVDLNSGSSSIPCHKDILCARNKVFRDLIIPSKDEESNKAVEPKEAVEPEQSNKAKVPKKAVEPDEPKKVVEPEESKKAKESAESNNIFLGDNYEVMKKIVAYVYTGNLKHIFEKPSLAILDCAALCEVSEVTDHYTTDTLLFQSSSNVQQLSFTWGIKDYKTLLKNGEFACSELIKDSSNRSWKLDLSASRRDDHEFIFTFYLKSVEKFAALRVYLELGIEDESGYCWSNNELLSNLDCSERFGFKEAFSTGEVPRGDTLTLIVKLKLCTGTDHPVPRFERHSIQSVTCPEDRSYRALSDDLNKMLQEGAYHDFRCESSDIKAHKFLIDTRCCPFYDLLKKPEEIVKRSTIQIILSYIYSGVLPSDVSDPDLIKVYKATAIFEFSALKKSCKELLMNRSKGNSKLKQYAVRAAEDIEDKDLISEFLKLGLNADIKALGSGASSPEKRSKGVIDEHSKVIRQAPEL